MPNKFDYGTLTLSNITIDVGDAFQPILSSNLPNDNPGVPFSTIKHETSFSDVLHITKYTSLTEPPEIKHFEPFII